MRSRQQTQAAVLRTVLALLALLLFPSVMVAQEMVTVQLEPVGQSGVSGTATLAAAAEGTDVQIEVQGLAPDAEAQATMHAGTCALPSASFAPLPDLKADATGTAAATGPVLFRGTDPVALETMADGEHVILIQFAGDVVACGTIPALSPASLPLTGGAAIPLGSVVLGVVGLCTLGAGLAFRSAARP
jgi:hypothetical protein